VSISSDNFTALIYLKNQVRKWKSLTFIILVITLILLVRALSGSSIIKGDKVSGDGDYIANITVEGIIFDDTYREEILKKIAEQKNIKAVIVNVNSPGGGIVGSEILYENLREIAKNKPLVTLMGSLAASGGYMASIASDHIIARNGTLTGSVGVIMQSGEITDLASKLGIKFTSYKSSPLKGAPSPFEKTNPEVDKVINESVKDSHKFFSDLVLERRKGKLNKNEIHHILDGRVFTGRQALKSGLIDEIGGNDEALVYLKNNHKIDTDKIKVRDVTIKKPDSKFLETLLGQETLARFSSIYQPQQLMAIWGSAI
jgi:protease-4